MVLPIEIHDFLTIHFDTGLNGVDPVMGGCINSAARFTAHNKQYFIKWNKESDFPKMLDTECRGLELIQAVNVIRVPEVILNKEINGYSFLVLEFIQHSYPNDEFWREFGIQVGLLHQNRTEKFGLEQGNYIGSLNQSNKQALDWSSFFIEQRILPQLELAGLLFDTSDHRRFQRMFKELNSIFPPCIPSLLHGDLWNGNFIVGRDRTPYLIDPSVYYGHPEMELAFTRLFGGFDLLFYKSYQSINQLEKGFSSRIDIYNLYPLLVHANLFGGGYFQQIRQIIKKF